MNSRKNYDFNSVEGRVNISVAIKDYHKKLNSLYPVDIVMSNIALSAFFLTAGGYMTLGLGAVGIDVFLKLFYRNPRNDGYQEELAKLISIYSTSLKTYGANITTDKLFIELMEIIAPCLTLEQGRIILTPDNIKAEYTKVSKEFEKILAMPPHNREIVICQITQAQTIKPAIDQKNEILPENSCNDYFQTAGLWCSLYGYNAKAAVSRKNAPLEEAFKAVKCLASKR